MAEWELFPASWQTWSMWSNDGFQRDHGIRGLARHPPGIEHPLVADSADHRATANEVTNLLVGDLPVAGNQGPAIVVAGQQGAFEKLHCLPKAIVGQMADIENHAHLVHGAQKVPSLRQQPSHRARAVRVGAHSEMGGADHPQPVLPPFTHRTGLKDGSAPSMLRINPSGVEAELFAFHSSRWACKERQSLSIRNTPRDSMMR